MGPVEPQVATTDAQSQVTDGFHLVIDALKLNGIDTIFGLPGIPITDLTRKAQAEGMRVISFRHEQSAGNAAFRVLRAEARGGGMARPIRAAVSGRPGGVYLDLPAQLFAQTMAAVAGRKSLIKVVDSAPRQIPAQDPVPR